MADTCGQVLLGSGLTVLSHPLMYIKVLVQVGHEPLPPSIGRNLFGRQVYQLPGLFAYAKHIIKIDGKAGLFNGLAPRLCAGTIGTLVHSRVLQRCQDAGKYEVSGTSQKAEEGSLQHVVNETTKEMIARSCATIVTHPFHVITLRCMVQFIGRETKYSGVFDSIVTVYKNEGVLGFFVGLIPRLLGDVLSLWICNMLAHLVNTYAIDDSVSQMDLEIFGTSLKVQLCSHTPLFWCQTSWLSTTAVWLAASLPMLQYIQPGWTAGGT
uniref:Mitochondrial carrier homolog 2 n=1 Tax=Oncorhynchus mykiss TaxID=8022 RepID=A0A8C7UA12_ONCMY